MLLGGVEVEEDARNDKARHGGARVGMTGQGGVGAAKSGRGVKLGGT